MDESTEQLISQLAKDQVILGTEMAKQVQALEQRNAELQAQVELLREAINGVRNVGKGLGFVADTPEYLKAQRIAWAKLNEATEATSAQCLAEVKAQAVEDCRESYNEALEFAIKNRDWDFLDCWIEGYWQAINDEWPEFNLQSEAQLSLMQESGFDTKQLCQQAKAGE